MRHLGFLLVAGGCFASLATAATLEVLPRSVHLTTKESRQQLLAQSRDGEFHADLTRTAAWTSSNPAVATVDAQGLVTPLADGQTTIRAAVNGLNSQVTITVSGQRAPFTWNFTNHVTPVVTKTGCNQGACHGALAGKNGFKLTLRGYDPEVDFYTLTRQATARRISLAEPENSLLLKKAVFAIPHGGGKRFAKDSLEYRVIKEWIEAGTPPPTAQDPEVTELEVYPASVILKPNAEQQLVVRAKYADGKIEDVTRWVKFGSNNDGVASVDDFGRVKTSAAGEAAITLWYNNRVLYARVAVPFDHQVDPKVYSSYPRSNFIDDHIVAKLQALRLEPSKLASDAEFIRRAYLDAAGVLPTSEEVENFLADTRPNKRALLVDHLLTREEFNDHWAYRLSDLMLVSSRRLRSPQMWSFYNSIRDSVRDNKPWDQFARDIFTSTGSSRQNGAANYFVLHKDPIDTAENTTQAFLGQRLTCARCHNHPLEKWTQKQYYQFANLFARVALKNGDEGEPVIYAKTSGDINHPRLLRPLEPTPLDGQPMSLDSLADRRTHFAQWLTAKNNHFFARNIINRVWGHYMGRGLCHPVDDVRATNPASNEELFAALEKDFTANGFDLRRLMRLIMTSTAYQLSSESNSTNQRDDMFYSRYIIKRLPAETLLDAMSQVTGAPSSFPGYPDGTRALQLPDVRVQSQFLDVFGRPPRILCDAGERSQDPSIAQALHVINGDTLNKKLSREAGSIALLTRIGLSDAKILDQIFLSAVSRYPTAAEKSSLLPVLAQARQVKGSPDVQRDARRAALEDLTWALLTSKEFLFNH
jgi:hypothetical protein